MHLSRRLDNAVWSKIIIIIIIGSVYYSDYISLYVRELTTPLIASSALDAGEDQVHPIAISVNARTGV